LNIGSYISIVYRLRRLRKDLGQHLLVSPGVLRRLVEFLDLSGEDTVVEIGGGSGNLTREILKGGPKKVFTLEIDPHMAEVLRSIKDPRLTVIEADATLFDLCSLGENLKVIGNLPYNVASLIVENTVRCRSCVPLALFMVQKEVALRITGKGEPGWITLFVNTFYRTEYMMSLPPKFFLPRPKVESGVVRFLRREDAPDLDPDRFKRFLTFLFSGRKKKLKNLLPEGVVRSASLDPNLRPHQLSREEILKLYNVFES
jgi:16S rRNA (adenine1518-N6/adenine1519-N6)-dimethyltransferase